MATTPSWSKQAVGATGVRRIVPMLGVDYIAGQIQIKKKPYTGSKKASMGGRTRYWSTINFLSVASGQGRSSAYTAEEIARQERFGLTSQTASTYMKNLQVLQPMMTDFSNDVSYYDVKPSDQLNLHYYCWKVIHNFLKEGGTLPQTPTWPLVIS